MPSDERRFKPLDIESGMSGGAWVGPTEGFAPDTPMPDRSSSPNARKIAELRAALHTAADALDRTAMVCEQPSRVNAINAAVAARKAAAQ